jgi:hypothetical protein
LATEYSGSPVLHVSITVLDDLDLKNAASVAVPLQQLQDSVMYLNGIVTGGIDFDFTDATFHGTTTFADGSIAAPGLTGVAVSASADITMAAGDDMTLTATDALALGGNAITLGAAAALALSGNAVAIGSATDVQINSVSLDVRSGQLTVAAGAIQIGTGADAIVITGDSLNLGATDLYGNASCNVALAGAVVFDTASDVEAAGLLRVTGKLRLRTSNHPGTDSSADGTGGYEHIFPDPAANRLVTLAHTGAAIGQRLRFNAQNVTGSFSYAIGYGVKTWFMRNATGNTVILEFVSNGSAWVVDDWAEGGVGLRNG